MALTLTLNGELRTFDDLEAGDTLLQLLEGLGLKADRVAAERNGEIVARALWPTTALGPGDRPIPSFSFSGVVAVKQMRKCFSPCRLT